MDFCCYKCAENMILLIMAWAKRGLPQTWNSLRFYCNPSYFSYIISRTGFTFYVNDKNHIGYCNMLGETSVSFIVEIRLFI